MIEDLAGQGYSAKRCCRILGVAASGYFRWKKRIPSEQELRRRWLTGLITEIHRSSRGTYGYRRVRAELVLGHGIGVTKRTVARLMRQAELKGLPARKGRRGPANAPSTEDLVERSFHRAAPNELWMTDITEHLTREGKLYCCVVLDAHSRKVVGWSIDSTQSATLVTNALSMAIENRSPEGTIIHSDHGTQFSSWVFTERVRKAGLAPSMGTIGDAFDNAVIESFWARMQTELLDRKRWKTRIELSSAIFEYLEIFHNRTRRHSSLGMLTPNEYEKVYAEGIA